MSFVDQEIKEIVGSFWKKSLGPVKFPIDLESPAMAILPISIEKIPDLTIKLVYDWLAQRGICVSRRMTGESRWILGCLVAHRGSGIVFIDCSATEAEQRFTFAHEIAHFIRDYQNPRETALTRLGEDILPVLDGDRIPTNTERVDALLTGVPIGTYSDLMLRGPKNQFLSSQTDDIEKKADNLALELLAPWKDVLRVGGIFPGQIKREIIRATLNSLLQTHFGLPAPVATDYAARIANYASYKPSVRDWLGL